jgi:phosphatidylglycerol---prolipoprotein diacylglyceryl transferase
VSSAATIELHVDPVFELGPLSVAWHGLMIAVGIAVGAWLARRFARERSLDSKALFNLVVLLAVSGIVGARLLWLVESGSISDRDEWLGTRGFSFYGAILFGLPALTIYLRRERLGVRYLDALAAGFPLGMAVGRIGDVISGEHFGPPSELPWAIRYTHPDAEVPSGALAYHPGGLYELVLALAILAILWPLRRRFTTAGILLWTVIALYGAGRFAMFFARSDSDEWALGLVSSQWVSLALMVIALVGVARAKAPRRGRQAVPAEEPASVPLVVP